MSSEPKKHIIAARNFFFGTGCFVILPLPPGWAITQSYLEPDVHSTVEGKDLTWVDAGQTDQIIFHPLKKIALDLTIQIKRGKHDRLQTKDMQITSQGSRMVGGHPASYCMGEVKYGFLKKKSAQTLRFSLYCPELKRTLFLHFTGQCQEADLREIHDSVISLECH